MYLNIRVKNHGSQLQKIEYEAETSLEEALKELIVELKDKTTIEKCSLLPLNVGGPAVKKEGASEPPLSPSCTGMREDSVFAEALHPERAVKAGKKRALGTRAPSLRKEPLDARPTKRKTLTRFE